jgi:hypothetical protein
MREQKVKKIVQHSTATHEYWSHILKSVRERELDTDFLSVNTNVSHVGVIHVVIISEVMIVYELL